MFEFIVAILFAVLPPCQTDEAVGPACKWDASTQGNGQGTSFVHLVEGVTLYL